MNDSTKYKFCKIVLYFVEIPDKRRVLSYRIATGFNVCYFSNKEKHQHLFEFVIFAD